MSSEITLASLGPLLTPLIIFLARICDVSIGTLRIVFISRGGRVLASLLGFFEVLLWLVAIRQIFQHLDHPVAYLAYAGGFAAGTYCGLVIEGKLAMGLLAMRVITRDDASDLVEAFGSEGFGVTSFAARGIGGRVRLVFTVIRREHLGRARQIVQRLHPKAFVSISDISSAEKGVFPESRYRLGAMGLLRRLRKAG